MCAGVCVCLHCKTNNMQICRSERRITGVLPRLSGGDLEVICGPDMKGCVYVLMCVRVCLKGVEDGEGRSKEAQLL